jgi:hypothetical protein
MKTENETFSPCGLSSELDVIGSEWNVLEKRQELPGMLSAHGINPVLNSFEHVPVSLEQSDLCRSQRKGEQVAGRGS